MDGGWMDGWVDDTTDNHVKLTMADIDILMILHKACNADIIISDVKILKTKFDKTHHKKGKYVDSFATIFNDLYLDMLDTKCFISHIYVSSPCLLNLNPYFTKQKIEYNVGYIPCN